MISSTKLSNMLASTSLISSNFRSFHLKDPNSRIEVQKPYLRTNSLNLKNSCKIPLLFHKPNKLIPKFSPFRKKGNLQICQDSLNTQNPQDPVSKSEDELGNNNGSGGDWTTSFLLFLLWAGLMYYVFNLAPNQTPVLYSKLSLWMLVCFYYLSFICLNCFILLCIRNIGI